MDQAEAGGDCGGGVLCFEPTAVSWDTHRYDLLQSDNVCYVTLLID